MPRRKDAASTREMNLAQLYLDMARGIIVAINRDELVTEINRDGSETLGYSKAEIIGKNWFDNFLPENRRAEVKAEFHKMLSGETQLEYYENPVITKGGRELIVRWHNVPLRDPDGYIIGTLSSGEDVTERRRAQRASTQYRDRLEAGVANRTADYTKASARLGVTELELNRAEWGLQLRDAMLENLPDPIFLTDFSNNLIYVNQSASTIFEFERSRLIGLDFWQLVQPQSRQAVENALTELQEKREYQYETSYIRKDGRQIPLWVHSRVISTTQGDFILSQVHDITRARVAEAKVEELMSRKE